MKTFFAVTSLLFILFLSPVSNAQTITVTGFVSNSNSGEFLESVNIFESVSTIGTLSDKHGFYKLMLKKGDAKILATYSGYNNLSKQFVLKNDTIINLQMVPTNLLKGKQKPEDQAQHISYQESGALKKKR